MENRLSLKEWSKALGDLDIVYEVGHFSAGREEKLYSYFRMQDHSANFA